MHKSLIVPRYSDMDSFGHINNACYLTYFEEARISFMNSIVNWKYDWSSNGVIVARIEIDYVMPTNFRDEIYVYTSCSKIGTKSFTLEYKMVKMQDGKEVVLSKGNSVLVMFDYV